ncbi:MAG: MarR family transcriptional regulator, partial [Exiguobacterium sp.]|nr:MarR family transcriptional regulator [Exiguobacterium sp.]
RRRCEQDNRVIYVELTDDGREQIAHWTEQKECLTDRLFVNMKVEDQQQLLASLTMLQDTIDHERKTTI